MQKIFLPAQHSPIHGLDHATCYRALSAKDSRFDGEFFVGVATTGIYCRPVCRVKTPRAGSCHFFPNASAAEAAGFRPCLRCRPELAPYALQQNLAHAIWHRIASGALNFGGNMQQLADQVGLSTRQLQRLMQTHFGVSPVELAQTARLLFAKKLLQETDLPMIDLAYAAGFGSVRRFNALFLERYGIAPSSIRRNTSNRANLNNQSADAITLRLAYRAPFAWDEMLNYLTGRLIAGVECIQGAGPQRFYLRSVSLSHGDQELVGWYRAAHLQKEQQIEVQVASQLAPILMILLDKIRQQFDLDANPTVIESHLKLNPLLAPQCSATPGLRVPGAFDSFELAIRAILGQQISVAAATTIAGRLAQGFGTPISDGFIPDSARQDITHYFPRAAQLAQNKVTELTQFGLTTARAETVLAFAKFAADGGLDLAPGIGLQQAVEQLKTVRGIGDWTAHYIALRALRFPDAFPSGDLGLQKALAKQLGQEKVSATQLQLEAEKWSPWRGYAALLLWQSLSQNP